MKITTCITATGYLEGNSFQGEFTVTFLYYKISFQVGMNGIFNIRLA